MKLIVYILGLWIVISIGFAFIVWPHIAKYMEDLFE